MNEKQRKIMLEKINVHGENLRKISGLSMSTDMLSICKKLFTLYPSNKSYDDILTLIEQDSEDITVWEPFEYHESEAIIKLIMEHKSCVLYSLNVFLE